MNRDNPNDSPPDALDRFLDAALERVVRDSPTEEMIERSSRRTWEAMSARLNEERIHSPQARPLRACDDYRQLIPAFLDGALNEARSLLLKDHTRECAPCRRALKEAREIRVGRRSAQNIRTGNGKSTVRKPGKRWKADLSWGIAAMVILGIALVGFAVNTRFFQFQTAGMLKVETIQGSLMEVGEVQTAQLASGQRLEDGEWIKTAKGSGAKVSLEDGSIVELDERSQLYVTRKHGNDTIHLERGSIIVQAAPQGAGNLFVETGDCNIAVTGTVFSVSNGLKGSRVSVIEGQVIVRHGSEVDTLRSGQQVTTAANLHPIPVSRDIAWSSDLQAHLNLLSEMTEFQRELNQRLPKNDLRFESDLLDKAPADTVFYLAVPNLSDHLSGAYDLMMEKIAANGDLAQLWKKKTQDKDIQEAITEVMNAIQKYGPMIGDEITLTLQKDGDDLRGPVVMADVLDPDALREELRTDLVRLKERTGENNPLFLLDGSMAEDGGDHVLTISIQGKLLVVAPTRANHQVVTGIAGASPFVGTPFHQSLVQAYEDGSGILFGADMARLLEDHSGDAGQARARTILGVDNIQHLIVNRREVGDQTETEAALSFQGERTGIASWLAEPAPMGALEFVSEDATAVGGFVVKNPSTLMEELLRMLPGEDNRAFLEDFKEATGLDLLADVVAPLGGEVVLALDGPVLPKPAWKLVMEVYDPTALQRTIESSVARLNESIPAENRIMLSSKQVGKRTYWTLDSRDAPKVHYTFVEGYLVVAPRRVFLERAIQFRESGNTLPGSRRFASLLPDSGRMNFSAMVYQNLGQVLGPLLNGASGITGQLTPEQRAGMQQVIDNMKPSLYLVYGEKDRIIFTSTDQSGLLGTDLGKMLHLGSILSLENILDHPSVTNHPAPVYDEPVGKQPGRV